MNPFNAGRKRGENPTRQAALARARRAGIAMPYMVRWPRSLWIVKCDDRIDSEPMRYNEAMSYLSRVLDEIAIRFGWKPENNS